MVAEIAVEINQENWREYAECRNVHPETFYPSSDAYAGPARAICSMCVVRNQCLIFALETGENHGVWGGLTAKERRRLSGRVRRNQLPIEAIPKVSLGLIETRLNDDRKARLRATQSKAAISAIKAVEEPEDTTEAESLPA